MPKKHWNRCSSGSRTALLAGLACAALLSAGCGKPAESGAVPAATQRNAESVAKAATSSPVLTAVANSQSDSALVGTWMGGAAINEALLEQVLQNTNPERRDAILREARTFVSTQMAIEFHADGSMETAVEIQPDGMPPIAGQTAGSWRIVEQSPVAIVVETAEHSSNGPVIRRKTWRISPEGNRIVMKADTLQELAGCEPLIWLDRQSQSSAAVADANGDVVR